MSAYKRNLNAMEQKELDDWLLINNIELNHRTRRDLSDVVHMAALFKPVLGKLVNMKHYTSHGNLAAKILNWETFNLNVLRKTGLRLKRPELEQLAAGDLTAIRALLYQLMYLEQNVLPSSERTSSKAQTPCDSSRVNNEFFSLAKYEELKLINQEKAECINLLKSKIKHLESVSIEKEKRINQLIIHLAALTSRIMAMQTRSENVEIESK